MAKSYSAQVDEFLLKSRRRMEYIARQSTNDVFVMASRTATAEGRGGAIKEGYVPRDTGFLAASAALDINGSTVGQGENVADLVITAMSLGDTAVMRWTAVYASIVHARGWLWVDVAAASWQSIVRRNAERARSMT